jgi:hypothetical protein
MTLQDRIIDKIAFDQWGKPIQADARANATQVAPVVMEIIAELLDEIIPPRSMDLSNKARENSVLDQIDAKRKEYGV